MDFWNLLLWLTTLNVTKQLKTRELKEVIMNRALKSVAKISVLSALAIAPVLMSSLDASAKPTGTRANYVGVGGSASVTNGGQDGDAAAVGGVIQGRYAVPKTPVSIRGSVQFTNETSTIIPMVTYDVPVTNKANFYVGGGYGLHESEGKPSTFGNRNAPVVTAGVEAEVAKNVVVFSDAKLGIKPYENSPASSVSVQLGVGYGF
ncbi:MULTISPECIES: outer membrane beta-barrel protein [unclassified Coleofasciculus]|uniref:outer membrane beta-barrel protein n=2 Tax=Cyanobacteriota TaxID=1117 RepID=UPI001F54B49F|nr:MULTISPECIES: outer membrane beta-barrel protein [unclassified Coleofasciculus]